MCFLSSAEGIDSAPSPAAPLGMRLKAEGPRDPWKVALTLPTPLTLVFPALSTPQTRVPPASVPTSLPSPLSRVVTLVMCSLAGLHCAALHPSPHVSHWFPGRGVLTEAVGGGGDPAVTLQLTHLWLSCCPPGWWPVLPLLHQPLEGPSLTSVERAGLADQGCYYPSTLPAVRMFAASILAR